MKKYFYLLTALFLVTGSLLIAASPQDDVDNQFSVGSYSDGMTLDSSGNLIPNADNVNDLGTTTYSWQDLVLDGDITLGDDITIGGDATITGTADVANILTDTLNLTKTDLTVSTSTKISTLGSSFYRIQSSAPVTGSAGDAIYMNSSGTDSCIQTTGRTAGDIVILYSSATTRKPVRILNSTTTQKIALGLVSGRTYLEIEDNLGGYMAGGWTARNYPKFTQFTDVRGRKSSGYHKHKNLAKEYTTAIVEMEEFMTRWAKEHGVNYGTCNKYMLARQISKEFHRDYMRAIQWFKAGNKKEIDFRDGF